MTSKIVVNNIEADAGVSTVTFNSNIERGSSNLHSTGLALGAGSTVGAVTGVTTYYGDGSQLTGITGTTINNQADNRMITCTGTANTLNAEQYLTYTSQSSLNLTDGVGTSNLGGNYLNLKRSTGNTNYINAPLADAELVISADEDIIFRTVHTADFNSTERMRLTSGGQLCIGTNTAVRALTIKNPGQIHVESTSTGNWVGMSIKGSSGTNNYNAYFGVLDSNGKFFVDNSSNGNDIEIESSASGQKAGRVLVGPSVPTSGDDSQVIIRNNESGGIYRCLRLNNQSNNNRITMTFEGNGTQTGDIRLNGSTTSYNSYSDYRLKENVVPLTDPITRLKTLKPYRFNFIASPDITLDGFFAHEVSPAVAEAVGGEKDDVDSDGNVVPQALDMAKLVPLLTASLQEAITKIETLEAEVAALKGS